MNRNTLRKMYLIVAFSLFLCFGLSAVFGAENDSNECVSFETINEIEFSVNDSDVKEVYGASQVVVTIPPGIPTTLAEKTKASTVCESSDDETTTCEEEEETVSEAETAPEIPIYTCHGAMLDEDLQEYIYWLLDAEGIGFYYETFLCQAFQESSYDSVQVTVNNGNNDCGLMQVREKYWDYFCGEFGYSGEILNAYDNAYIAVKLLAKYWRMYGSKEEMISHYMMGEGGAYCQKYVDDVMSHIPYLVRVR